MFQTEGEVVTGSRAEKEGSRPGRRGKRAGKMTAGTGLDSDALPEHPISLLCSSEPETPQPPTAIPLEMH